MKPLKSVDAIIFDFDGVLTDNTVYVSEDGKEQVKCNRSDGLAISELKKLKIKTFIISTEKNKVEYQRGKKLGISVQYGVKDKVKALKGLAEKESLGIDKVLFIGNDLNDLRVMEICGYSACPSDSHRKIKEISNYILKKKGGEGIVREVIESILQIDTSSVLY